MRKTLNKIKNNLSIIISEWKQDKNEYSKKLALIRFMGTIFKILRMNSISTIFLNKKNDIVLSYLEENYGHIFSMYAEKKNPDILENKTINELPIWICWLDGVENAPSLVQRCIDSIYNHANNHPVNLITWDNISNYIDMPQLFREKVLRKEMCLAHYSDILRVFLLEKYGGIWLDATIFCTNDIPDEYFEYMFFTLKSNLPTPGCISQNQWTTFCIGGCQGNVLFQSLKAFYLEYWGKENRAIDYLFFDDAIELARRLLPEVRREIEEVPQTNLRRDELILRFADLWSDDSVDDLLKSDTSIFKLGYREEIFLHKYNNKNELTIYGAFIEKLF